MGLAVPDGHDEDNMGNDLTKTDAIEIKRVALYSRVSTKGGRQDTENQLIALRDYCQKRDGRSLRSTSTSRQAAYRRANTFSRCSKTRQPGGSTCCSPGRLIASHVKAFSPR
jgi:hypothetical protein